MWGKKLGLIMEKNLYVIGMSLFDISNQLFSAMRDKNSTKSKKIGIEK